MWHFWLKRPIFLESSVVKWPKRGVYRVRGTGEVRVEIGDQKKEEGNRKKGKEKERKEKKKKKRVRFPASNGHFPTLKN